MLGIQRLPNNNVWCLGKPETLDLSVGLLFSDTTVLREVQKNLNTGSVSVFKVTLKSNTASSFDFLRYVDGIPLFVACISLFLSNWNLVFSWCCIIYSCYSLLNIAFLVPSNMDQNIYLALIYKYQCYQRVEQKDPRYISGLLSGKWWRSASAMAMVWSGGAIQTSGWIMLRPNPVLPSPGIIVFIGKSSPNGPRIQVSEIL